MKYLNSTALNNVAGGVSISVPSTLIGGSSSDKRTSPDVTITINLK